MGDDLPPEALDAIYQSLLNLDRRTQGIELAQQLFATQLFDQSPESAVLFADCLRAAVNGGLMTMEEAAKDHLRHLADLFAGEDVFLRHVTLDRTPEQLRSEFRVVGGRESNAPAPASDPPDP
jgi:hypothetical protein